MIIEFADETRIEALNIVGKREFIRGNTRDVLTIEFSTEVGLQELRTIFSNAEKTKTLHIIETVNDEEKKTFLGEEYTLYLSCGNKSEEIEPETGRIGPQTLIEKNYVEIGQKTYQEVLLEELLGEREDEARKS